MEHVRAEFAEWADVVVGDDGLAAVVDKEYAARAQALVQHASFVQIGHASHYLYADVDMPRQRAVVISNLFIVLDAAAAAAAATIRIAINTRVTVVVLLVVVGVVVLRLSRAMDILIMIDELATAATLLPQVGVQSGTLKQTRHYAAHERRVDAVAERER